jgi:hypothetical protein
MVNSHHPIAIVSTTFDRVSKKMGNMPALFPFDGVWNR